LITMVEGQLLAAAPAPPQQSFCSPILRCSSDLGKPSAFDLGPAPAPAAPSTFTTPIKARADPLKSMWSGEGDAAAEGASKELVHRSGLAKRKCERQHGSARLSALYPALYPRFVNEIHAAAPASDSPFDEINEPTPQKGHLPRWASAPTALGGNRLYFTQQRVEPGFRRRSTLQPQSQQPSCPSTPSRLAVPLPAAFAPEHHHVAAERRDPTAPLPSFDMDDDDDENSDSTQQSMNHRVVSRRLLRVAATVEMPAIVEME
jgi:hypothetical protein